MAGHELTQKLFYKVCAFIWTTNDIALGSDIKRYQDAVIEEVFGYTDKYQFLKYENQATEVTTWDGKGRAWISQCYLNKMVIEIGILRPVASVHGREVEQYLMEKMPDTIPERIFEESVNLGRASLKKTVLRSSYQEENYGSNYSESDVRRGNDSPLRRSARK